jgi:hypothetical protein
VKLLEPDKNKNALSFSEEALNIEFTQIIGNMDASCCIGSKKRDEVLAKMGKELLKEYIRYEKRKKFSISIRKRPNILSQKEIDELLSPVDKRRIPRILYKLKHTFDFMKYYWWEIKIQYKDRSWETGIFRNNKIESFNFDMDDIVSTGVLSEEDIDELLTPIDEENDTG